MRSYILRVHRGCHWCGAVVLLMHVAFWSNQQCLAQVVGTYTLNKIWSDGTYNAFTDLTRFGGKWYIVFRTATQHGIPSSNQPGGEIRVIESADGYAWTTAAVLSGTGDLRDPKITVTPNSQLMINAGDVSQIPASPGPLDLNIVQSAAWFSSDGSNWGNEKPIGDHDFWMWRVVWHNGVGYGISYGPNNTDPTGGYLQTTRLSATNDGLHYTTLVPQLMPPGHQANESGMTFLPNGTAVVLSRCDWDTTSSIGISSGDFTDWTFTKANLRVQSPDLLTLPDGRIVCAGRLYTDGTPKKGYTSLSWIDPRTATVTPFLAFPYNADGYDDTGYPGMYWYDNQLWISFHSTIDFPSDIFLAQVSISPASWTSAVSGSWNTASNWGGAVPGAPGAKVVINVPTISPLSIMLDGPQTVGTMLLDNPASPSVGYTLGGSGTNTLTLDNSGSGATISAADGTHVIDAPVILADSLTVTGGGTIEFSQSSSITETGGSRSLTMHGAGGTLILSGSDGYTGGTIVTAGTLILTSSDAVADGTSLTIGAQGALPFGNSIANAFSGNVSSDAQPVPEPCTLGLLLAGLSFVFGVARNGKRMRGLISILTDRAPAEVPKSSER
jgi:hypothetical protein